MDDDVSQQRRSPTTMGAHDHSADAVVNFPPLSAEQEMALQQIIESNHIRQLRSTSPLPISGAPCLGASAPPSHSDEEYPYNCHGIHGQHTFSAVPPFPTGSSLWRGMSGSPPSVSSTWNSYNGFGVSNSAGASASSSLSRRACTTARFATLSAGGLCGAPSNLPGVPLPNEAGGRASPSSSSSSSFAAGATASGGHATPFASGVNNLGLLEASVVAELERTSLQSLVSCVDAAMNAGAKTMNAAVVAELEKTSLHSIVRVMDASLQQAVSQNSPSSRLASRQWTVDNSPCHPRPKPSSPSRSDVPASLYPCEDHGSPLHDRSRGSVPSPFHPRVVLRSQSEKSPETASIDSSESHVEMQVTRSGEPPRDFLSKKNRDVFPGHLSRSCLKGPVGGRSGAARNAEDGAPVVTKVRSDSQVPVSVSTPASPLKRTTPSSAVVVAKAELNDALAELSASCPTSGFELTPSGGGVKQKCKKLMKRKKGHNGNDGEGGERTAPLSCVGSAQSRDESVSSDAGSDHGGTATDSAAVVPAAAAKSAASSTPKNHGYAAPIQTDAKKTPSHRVTSPALPQTPPPPVGSSTHIHFNPTKEGAAINPHGGGAKSKLKHLTSLFTRNRRRGKGGAAPAALHADPSECCNDHGFALEAETAAPPRSGVHPQDFEMRPNFRRCQVCESSDDGAAPSGKRASAKSLSSSKLISTVVGHLTGSPIRRPSAHGAAPPGRHQRILDIESMASCWGRSGAAGTANRAEARGDSCLGDADEAVSVDPLAVSLSTALNLHRQRPPHSNHQALLAEGIPFPSISAFLSGANPAAFPPGLPPRHHPLRHFPTAAAARDLAARLSSDEEGSLGGVALTSETQKSEYGSLGPDGRLIPRTVHTQIDYMHHLVNDLKEITACSFYWGVMDRYEAERLLDNKPEGTFLLRDSAQEDFLFSVSFRRYGRSLHARIEQWQHKFSFDALDPGVFSSDTVCGLIEHYKDPSCCMFFEPMLTIPLNRSFVFSLQHLCRAVICKNLSYDGINLLQLPNVSKDYLKYYHYKQKIRERRYETTHSSQGGVVP